MEKASLLCDKKTKRAKPSFIAEKPKGKFTDTPLMCPKPQDVSAVQFNHTSDSPERVTSGNETLIESNSPKIARHLSENCRIERPSSSAWVTEDTSSSPAVSPMKKSPRGTDKQSDFGIMRSSLPSPPHEQPQPRLVPARMGSHPQNRSSDLSSPLQRIFSRMRTAKSPRGATHQNQTHIDLVHIRSFPYEHASEGPEPVYVTSIRTPPQGRSPASPFHPNIISRAQSSREQSSTGSSESSPHSSRSSQLRLRLRNSMSGSPRSSPSSRLLDITSWTYKRKPKTNTKDRIKVLRPRSPPPRPAPPDDNAAPFVNVPDSPDISEQYFSSSPPVLMADSEEEDPPQACDASSIYSQDSEGQAKPVNMSSTSLSLDLQSGRTEEDLERRIKEHRRLAYYCINGGVRQRKLGGELSIPSHIFKNHNDKAKEEDSAEFKTPIRISRQLSEISEHEAESDIDSPSAAAEKRRRRKLAEIPPPEDEAFHEFIRTSAQKFEEREAKIQSRVEVTSDGRVIDRGATPPPLPPKNCERRVAEVHQKYQADRPIRTSPLQGQIWWEKQLDSQPHEDEVDSPGHEKPKSVRQKALSSEPEYVSQPPGAPDLPHFHTVEEAEAFRRSQSPAVSPAIVELPAQKHDEITALPPTDRVEEAPERISLSPKTKGMAVDKPGKGQRREKYRFSRWLSNKSAKDIPVPEQPSIHASIPETRELSSQDSSTDTSINSLSPMEKVKLHPEPLNLNAIRTPNSYASGSWRPRTPFLDSSGRLISPSERQKRFTQIRAAAIEQFESSSPLPIISSSEQSPAWSDQTSPSPGFSRLNRSDTPSSSPAPLTPSDPTGYEAFTSSNSYKQEDNSSSEGEIVELYLHPEPSPDSRDGQIHSIGFTNSSPDHSQPQEQEDPGQDSDFQTQLGLSRQDPDEEERREWYESDAKQRVDKIRQALQTKSVYGGRGDSVSEYEQD